MFVQPVERLVQNKKTRIFHNGLGNSKALAHAKGVFSHSFFHVRVKAYLAKNQADVSFGDLPSHIRQNFQIFSACILGEKAGSFDDDSETFREIHIPADLLSEYMDRSCRSGKETADAFHQHCFAGAIISHNTVNLSAVQGKIDLF